MVVAWSKFVCLFLPQLTQLHHSQTHNQPHAFGESNWIIMIFMWPTVRIWAHSLHSFSLSPVFAHGSVFVSSRPFADCWLLVSFWILCQMHHAVALSCVYQLKNAFMWTSSRCDSVCFELADERKIPVTHMRARGAAIWFMLETSCLMIILPWHLTV